MIDFVQLQVTLLLFVRYTSEFTQISHHLNWCIIHML